MDCQTIQAAWRRHAVEASPCSESCPAADLADAFMAARDTAPDLCCIDTLCELALEDRFQGEALRALYGRIVEPLCDDFSAAGVRLCNLVLLRLIDFVRRTPQGKQMDARLVGLGYPDSAALAGRYQRLQDIMPFAGRDLRKVGKVIVLSRVTVGADIAITTVIVHRLLAALPAAELVLIGPSHLAHCFAGLDRVRCQTLLYERDASLVDRLLVWEALDALVQAENRGFGPGEVILFDPDSRLTQLGLLPFLAVEDTYFFPSRFNPVHGENPDLGELANRWLDTLLGENGLQPPTVSLPAHDRRQGTAFIEGLRAAGCRHVVVVNCGVGGDDRKRLGASFEQQLPPALLERLADTVIVFDTGCAVDEKKRVLAFLDRYRDLGLPTDFVDEAELGDKKIAFSHGVIGFHGSIGGIGALIDGADLFFGYDSCCQHLAGALQTPSLIVFAGAPNQRFAARWRPYDATGRSVILSVADKSAMTDADLAGLVEQVVLAMISILKKE